ncbi:MAG TPA: hypothetical protein DIW47_12180 [Bacteroidetes bacterium]|nr:hypothetical protein [Bacteroidota bacterium]
MKGSHTLILCIGLLALMSCTKDSKEAVSENELISMSLEKLDSFQRPIYDHEIICRAAVCDPNNSNKIYYCRENQGLKNEILEYDVNTKSERLVYSYPNKRVSSLNLNSLGQLLILGYDANNGEIVCVNIHNSQVEFTLTNEKLYPILGGVWLNDTSFTFTKFSVGPGESLICNGKGDIISSSVSYDDLVILSPAIDNSVYYCKSNDSIQTYGKQDLKTLEYQTSFKFFYKHYPIAFAPDKANTGFWSIQPLTRLLYYFDENSNLITENSVFQSNIILNYLAPYPDGDNFLISVSVYSQKDGQEIASEYIALSNLKDKSIRIIKEIQF